ncbi:MAG: hypothetical protein KDI29_17555, partial [Pseudomonadales bacterium]|nr:hypothetical protein [Pseudomonadales bacterium]
MKHAVKIALLVTSIFPLHQVLAVEPGNGLTTEWGDPDLQGVWNFSTEIPFERPERFGDREFLTQEEIQDIKARLEADAAAGAVVEADPDFADR